MSEGSLLLAWRIITVVGLGTLLFWMGKTIKAMQKTVETQRDTISAQSAKMDGMEKLLKTMETVLKSTDEQNMLARLKAHKEFVEEEKGALVKRMAVQFEGEKTKILQGSETEIQSALQRWAETTNYLVHFATNSLPYVPPNRREEFVNGVDAERLKNLTSLLHQIAHDAPDLQATSIASIRIGGSANVRFIPVDPQGLKGK